MDQNVWNCPNPSTCKTEIETSNLKFTIPRGAEKIKALAWGKSQLSCFLWVLLGTQKNQAVADSATKRQVSCHFHFLVFSFLLKCGPYGTLLLRAVPLLFKLVAQSQFFSPCLKDPYKNQCNSSVCHLKIQFMSKQIGYFDHFTNLLLKQ